MRVLVTGATGFVGRWLVRELEAAGHEAFVTPRSSEFDVTDSAAVADLVREAQPDAVAHLAAVSYAGDANRDPDRALLVNRDGTSGVIEAVSRLARPVPVLISGSSEVYGRPDPGDLPLREDAPLRADLPYGRSKEAQERTALELGAELGVPVVATRSFNHTGPGQRAAFVAPALARRLLEARRTGAGEISAGNVDVRRDIGDVRDVARAYRLLIEGLADGRVRPGLVVNVATGRSIAIRRVLEMLAEAAGISVVVRIDPALVRANDPPEIVGDASLMRQLTGWEPSIRIERTLRDLVASIEDEGQGVHLGR